MFLRLDGLVITSAGPYMKRDGKGVRGRKGCQIDLLIQARRTICIVENKAGFGIAKTSMMRRPVTSRSRTIRIREIFRKSSGTRRAVGCGEELQAPQVGASSPRFSSSGCIEELRKGD